MNIKGRMNNAGTFLAFLLLVSCAGMHEGRDLPLVRLAAGAEPPQATTRIAAVLAVDSRCAGNGTTVVIWVRAEVAPGNGNTVVIWPRSATARRDGNGATVVVWARSAGADAQVRIGQRVLLEGEMKDDVSGLRLDRPLAAACRGPAFVVHDVRPAA